MVDKSKKYFECNIICNVIIPSILLVFGILLLRRGLIPFDAMNIKVQGFIFIWCLLYLFIIVRNSMIAYRKLSNNREVSNELKDIIINSNPCGIATLNNAGVIEFLNPAIKDIFGSDKAIGLNALEFETFKKHSLYDAVYEGLQGKASQVLNFEYITDITKEKKVLNVNINPVFENDDCTVKKVILIFDDVTQESSLKNKVKATNISTLKALAHLVDARDDYTGRHSSSVTRYTEILCDCLNLSEEERDYIVTSANLHDIGKIGIDDSILKKPGSLTATEYNKMKTHPTIGSSIIGDINGFEEIGKIIKHHHERYDGKGYPDGLKGDEIPLGAQIIAIADTFDAITTNRVYRSSLGYFNAVRILKEERDKQFNSFLVDMFLEKVEELHIDTELDNVG